MPAAPRIKGKAAQIAFSVLGVPANLKQKKSAHQKEIDRQLQAQNTHYVK